MDVCRRANQLLATHPHMKVDAITVKKDNVQTHIRQDPNTLYNWMTAMVVPGYVSDEERFLLVPDERSLKVRSHNSLKEYLQIKLWYECGSGAVVDFRPGQSRRDYGLQLADWLCHAVWRNYELKEGQYLQALRAGKSADAIRTRELFFSPQVSGQVPVLTLPQANAH